MSFFITETALRERAKEEERKKEKEREEREKRKEQAEKYQEIPKPIKHSPSPENQKTIETLPVQDESVQEKQDRLWEKIKKKVNFTPVKDYYKEMPIKPGFHFFKALAQAKSDISQLDINIPETYINFENSYWIDNTNGKLSLNPDATYQEFEQALMKRHGEFYELKKKDSQRVDTAVPFLIIRTPQEDHTCYKTLVTIQSLKESKRYSTEQNSIYQRYLIPKGGVVTVTRLVFHTNNSRDAKANYAYRMQNKENIIDKSKGILIPWCYTNTEHVNSFYLTHMTGIILREYEKSTEKLVNFLEKSYSIRILRIVTDFMTDFEERTWLINVKAIELVQTIPLFSQVEGSGKKTYDELICSVSCKLCGRKFKKDDAAKTLTYKLLWEFVQHRKKRECDLFGIKVTHNSTRPCRVCDLCYMLAVSEHELIDMEQKFARAQNIPIKEALERVPTEQTPLFRPALVSARLYQWRILLFFHSVTNLELDNAYFDPKNIQLQFKLFNQTTSFKLTHIPSYDDTKGEDHGYYNSSQKGLSTNMHLKKMLESKGEINFPKKKKASGLYMINSMRVHYFFSETTDIQKFLDESEVQIRLVRGEDWNNYFAEGTTTSTRHFKNFKPSAEMNHPGYSHKSNKDDYDGNQKKKPAQTHQAQILCFFENGRYCTAKALFGLVCDDLFNTSSMNLHKFSNVYVPDSDFYNCEPFPLEWMEIFEQKDILMNETVEEKKERVYSPKCSTNDIAKMTELPESNPHKGFSGVDSVVKRTWSGKKFDNMKTNSSIMNTDAKNTASGFKFGTISEKPNRRIFSAADANRRKLDPIAKDNHDKLDNIPERNDARAKTFFAEDHNNHENANLDQDIELLQFLTKKQQPIAQLDKKIGKSQGSYLQNFELQFKHLEDEELIKRYIKNDNNIDPKQDITANSALEKEEQDFTHKKFEAYLEDKISKATKQVI